MGKKKPPLPLPSLNAEKGKATKLLTAKIKEILSEQTEVEEIDGQPIMVTKSEKLARLMVKMALGYTENVTRISEGKTVIDTVVHQPHCVMIGLLYDRIEGKIPMAKEEETVTRTLSDRVSEQGKNRIHAAGKIIDATSS
jgi:hypothetical protein